MQWNRAKLLKKILSSESMPDVERWTVKTFFMYSRSHLYSQPLGYNIFKKHSLEISLINSCFANSFSQGNRKRNFPVQNDEAVDIESEQGSYVFMNLSYWFGIIFWFFRYLKIIQLTIPKPTLSTSRIQVWNRIVPTSKKQLWTQELCWNLKKL